MKRLSTIMMCLFAMMAASLSTKAQEVTITLYPGWTWISYPKAEVLDINTALGDFVPMEGDIIKSQFSNSTYSRGNWRGGVTHFIPGWGYKYYSNRTEVVSFVFGETAPQLTVTTAEPTEITATSAISGGSITSNDGSYIYVFMKGICWATHPNPMVMNDFFTENGSGAESFTAEMTDLSPNAIYYVRAYAVTLNGTTYGEELSFITRSGIPDVSTDSVTNILGDRATCGGIVAIDSGLIVMARGVCWSTNHNPTVDDSHTADSTGIGSFTSTLANLTPNTLYYVRAYASSYFGTGYGEEVCFTTQNGIPQVSTASVTNIMCLHATCGGIVSDDGGLNIVSRGVCWSNSHNPTTSDNHTSDGIGLGSFASSITELLAGTVYYVRAYASTNQATTYGEEIVFTTSQSGSGNAPVGAIDGIFSVSDYTQVYISQGNLQYIGSTNVPYWKFAEYQWDYLGDNGQGGSSQNVNRDLFGWGTSGYNHGAVCYQPWSTSQTTSDYYAYGSYEYNLYDQTGEADWGYNPISNGGNASNQWRTLTSLEWTYLFKTRTTASGIRYAKAKVNDVNGMILLPDDWDANYYSLNSTNTSGASFSSNTITASQWNTLEQHGAVFLPAAGYCGSLSVSWEGERGFYWSATRERGISFHWSLYSPDSYYQKLFWRCSVRLVCPTQ